MKICEFSIKNVKTSIFLNDGENIYLELKSGVYSGFMVRLV